jgi:hypothetical protein
LERFNCCALNVADIWNNNVLYHAEPCGCLYRGLNVSSQQLLVIVKVSRRQFSIKNGSSMSSDTHDMSGTGSRTVTGLLLYDIVQFGRYGSFGGTCYVYV